MNCYGKNYNRLESCRACRLKRWCTDASDPYLLTNHMAPYDEGRGGNCSDPLRHPALDVPDEPDGRLKQTFTREDMLTVIRAMLRMDLTTLDILCEKLKNPELRITMLGRRKKLPRQRIYSHLHRAFSVIPELREAVRVPYGYNINGADPLPE